MTTLRDLSDLTGRVALVTGGAGHIGSAIVDGLMEQDCRVVVIDKDTTRCDRWWHDINMMPRGWRGGDGSLPNYLAEDLMSSTGIASAVVKTVEIFSRLDILVNCAGMTSYPTGFDVPLAEQTAEAWDACMAVNLRAPFLLAQACAPLLAASGHGSIINVASIYGLVGPDLRLYGDTGMGCAAAYAASKGGLIQLTRYLATVMAPDVRVNAIVPGGVLRGQDAGFRERYCARVPLGRMATESDMVGAVAFLASDASAYVTGQALAVDGGWTAW